MERVEQSIEGWHAAFQKAGELALGIQGWDSAQTVGGVLPCL